MSNNEMLLQAVEDGNLDKLKHCLSLPDIDCNYKNIYGMPLIIIAARSDEHEIIEALLNHGANVNEFDESKQTALIHAADYGATASIQLLLSNNCMVDHIDDFSSNALMAAVNSGYTDCVKLILDRASNLNHADNNGNTALHYALDATGSDTPFIPKNILEITKLLLERGCDFNIANHSGQTALMMAREMMVREIESIEIKNVVDMLKAFQDQQLLLELSDAIDIQVHGPGLSF